MPASPAAVRAALCLVLFLTLTSFPAHAQISESPDALLLQARSLADKGVPTEADRLVRQYLEKNPASADGHFLLGYILFREIQEHAAEILTSSKQTEDLPPRGAKNTTAGQGFREAAAKASLAEYTEGAKYRKPSAADLKIVALDYILLGDYADADKWLTKMLEWAPNDAEGWYHLGRTKYNENRFSEAISAFQKSLQLAPNNVKAEDNLGLSYAGLGRNDEAIAAYQNAIAWQNDAPAKNPGPFIDLGSLLLDLNKTDDALAYLNQAIEIAPQNSKPHELLGKAYARLDQLPKAQGELEKAIELAPEIASLHCMIGPVYRRQGFNDKAKFAQDRCAALNGTHSSPEIPRQ